MRRFANRKKKTLPAAPAGFAKQFRQTSSSALVNDRDDDYKV